MLLLMLLLFLLLLIIAAVVYVILFFTNFQFHLQKENENQVKEKTERHHQITGSRVSKSIAL